MDPAQPSRKLPVWIGALMLAAAATLAVASVLHFGVAIPLGVATISDPFGAAAIPEAVIAVVVAIGAVTVLTRSAVAWWVALLATLFALLGTAYGLTVTVRRGQAGDVAYHLSLLAVLVVTTGLLLTSRRALSAS
jgi:hypothetical protein